MVAHIKKKVSFPPLSADQISFSVCDVNAKRVARSSDALFGGWGYIFSAFQLTRFCSILN